jgi:hypothetical protein
MTKTARVFNRKGDGSLAWFKIRIKELENKLLDMQEDLKRKDDEIERLRESIFKYDVGMR